MRMVEYWNWRNRIAYAPPGEGEGGGGDGDVGDSDAGETGEESGDEGEINVDGLDLLNQLFTEPKKLDADGKEIVEEEEDEAVPSDIMTSEQMTAHLNDSIGKMALPADFIPADFDPSNREQMMGLFNKSLKIGVTQALNSVFKPVENAMKMHAHSVRKDIGTRMRDMGSMGTEEKFLERELPASMNPQTQAITRTIWNQAKLQHPKDRTKALTMARKSLQAMNINPDNAGPSRGNQQNGNGSSGVKRGAAALDSFMKMPNPGTTRTNAALKR